MKSLEQQVKEEMPEFVSEVASASTEQLDARLAQLAKDLEAVNDAKEADEELKEARETASAMAQPYRDAKKHIALKSRYIVSLLKDRGN